MEKTTSGDERIFGLEFVRFFAAVSVLIWHYQHFFYVSSEPVNFIRSEQPFYALLSPFYDYGYWGVQIFWTLSGFIFFVKYSESIGEKKISWWKFFVLRFSRLYPLHVATLMLVLLLQSIYFSVNEAYFVYQFNDFRHFLLHLFFASNWGFEGGYSFNGPIWSVSAEVVVYVIFFILVRTFGSSIFFIALLIFSFLMIKYLGASGAILACLTYFFAGGVSAWFFSFSILSRASGKLFSLIALTFLALLLSSVYFNVPGNMYVSAVLPLFIFPILISFFAQYMNPGPYWAGAVEVAGNLTYASYLIHFPIQLGLVIIFDLTGFGLDARSFLLFIFYLFSTFTLSFFTFRFFELPCQKYLRRLML